MAKKKREKASPVCPVPPGTQWDHIHFYPGNNDDELLVKVDGRQGKTYTMTEFGFKGRGSKASIPWRILVDLVEGTFEWDKYHHPHKDTLMHVQQIKVHITTIQDAIQSFFGLTYERPFQPFDKDTHSGWEARFHCHRRGEGDYAGSRAERLIEEYGESIGASVKQNPGLEKK